LEGAQETRPHRRVFCCAIAGVHVAAQPALSRERHNTKAFMKTVTSFSFTSSFNLRDRDGSCRGGDRDACIAACYFSAFSLFCPCYHDLLFPVTFGSFSRFYRVFRRLLEVFCPFTGVYSDAPALRQTNLTEQQLRSRNADP